VSNTYNQGTLARRNVAGTSHIRGRVYLSYGKLRGNVGWAQQLSVKNITRRETGRKCDMKLRKNEVR
jgi:hypothetical protein